MRYGTPHPPALSFQLPGAIFFPLNHFQIPNFFLTEVVIMW